MDQAYVSRRPALPTHLQALAAVNTVNKTTLDSIPLEQRFQLLVDGVRDYALFMLDPDGYISSWNSGAQRIKGYTADEVMHTHFSRFYMDDERQAGVPDRALAIATAEGRYEQEGWRLRKDGSRFWASVVIDAIRNDNGDLLGFAKITRDMTERRQTADALEHARSRLVQAQKMEAIGQLTGGIAHDFNNILAVIINSLDLLALRMATSPDLSFVEKAQRAAERGANLTRQLLAYARRQPLQPEKQDLNALVSGFEEILRRACPESIVFELILAQQLQTVLLDSQQFETALLNLVVNARDAMPDGGTISIRTENVAFDQRNAPGCLVPGDYVRVALSDTGHGMTNEAVQHAFEPFFTTKAPGKGSGLGLSQVYGFVAQSGGDVTIDTALGDGTTVTLYFPAVAADVEESSEETTTAPVEPRLHAGKVLIVEDNPDVMEVSVEIFRGLDFEVLTASNGMAAIDMLKRTRDIDVLFTDVVMPMGMNGIELARFTRKLCPDIHIILASGYPIPVLAADYGALDEFAFIGKPYRWTELLEQVRLVKKKRQGE